MISSIPEEVKNIIKIFRDNNFEIYIVGGAVRDLLMGKMVVDWDYTTNATPEQIQELFEDSFYDNSYGTVGIPSKVDGVRPHEITTFRREAGYSDARRPDKVEWGESLEEDLSRRDFTINAMGLKIRAGEQESRNIEIIDPYDGQKDLERKLIRAVGDAHERFSEDGLRMMRAVRFAAELNFKIEGKTLEAIQNNATLINKIAKERVRDELLKILKSSKPDCGIEKLRDAKLLELILPELEKTFGVDQVSPERHHIYDVGTHLLMSLKHCRAPDPITRLATLIHDIGKPQTYTKTETGVITFYNHEVIGARMAKNIAERLRLSKAQKEKLYLLVRWHQFTVDEMQTDKALRRFITKVGLENVEDMLELRRADRLGSGARETSWRTEAFKERLVEVQKQPFSVHDLKIKGNEIMSVLNMKPGPKVGEILQKLFEEVEDKRTPNEYDALLARLSEIAKSI